MADRRHTSLTERGHRFARRFRRSDEGASAVEFALIAAPFFIILFGLLEVCMIFIISTTLEHGVAEAARQIRTGQIQESGSGEAEFKQLVCDNTFGLLDCTSRLKVDVKVFDNFAAADDSDPLQDGEVDDGSLEFDPGGGDDIVLARVLYEWELITPVLSAPLSNMNGNKRLLRATLAFRNEPFGE